MPTTLQLPETLDDCEIKTWSKREGDAVAAGEPVCTVERDGAAHSIPAPLGGVVARIVLPTGTRCGGGAPLAILTAPGEEMGWPRNGIACVRVALRRKCNECGNDYPVNGLVQRARCRACRDVDSAPLGYWQSYVFECVTEVLSTGKPDGSNVLGGNYGPASIACSPVVPLCRKCSTLLDWDAFLHAVEEAQGGPAGDVHCGQCGEEHRLRMTPGWAQPLHPKLTAVLGETAVEPSEEKPAGKPVLFPCASCGAALKIDGSKRIVRCEFCEADNYLPPDLWLHLNPATKRARWWLLFRP